MNVEIFSLWSVAKKVSKPNTLGRPILNEMLCEATEENLNFIQLSRTLNNI